MADDAGSREVQSDDAAGADRAEDVVVIPVVPAPAAGWTAGGGQLGSAAGGLMQPMAGLPPVAGAAPATPGAQDEGGAFDDADSHIAQRLEEALANEGRLQGADVAVAVEDGVVEIIGSVPSERERRIAEEICAAASGVRAVRNRLSVAE